MSAVEFAGQDHVYSSFNELETLLLNKKFIQNSTNFVPWEEMTKTLMTFLESV